MAIHSSPSVSADQNGIDNSSAVRDASDGIVIERHFCPEGVDPFEQVTWKTQPATIKDENDEVIFRQDDVEVPEQWSQLATNVVVSKYFYGEQGSEERESSVRELVHRVSRTIADWARKDGIFASDADADNFYDELTWLCLNQYGAFNSPVWFNVGLFDVKGVEGSEGNFHWDKQSKSPTKTLRGYEYPQCSACFIQSVDDTMEDIMRLAASEAMLFKYGSGTGTDLSTLRSEKEKLSGGGRPSGPLSFMRVFDQIAAVVKSGGKTRRAAKMQSLRCDHPDILEFIECKAREEKKAWALIDAGYDGNYNGEAYSSVMYQNANLSVRVTDEFLHASENEQEWCTYAVTDTDRVTDRHNASELFRKLSASCHLCGDPGVQYDTTINNWHTCPSSGRINASNPCSEYMFLDDSA
ncbi:MAG: vitamin B12-dependent ribonucleotide reductase, partial [Phycisphaerae bacterium]|nr:vitamin B12-dependent ribonucleotide reductase [Phycisphaerae bacterium]